MGTYTGSLIGPTAGSDVEKVPKLDEERCPKCGTNMINNRYLYKYNDGIVTLKLSCLKCHARWQTIFVFQGVYLTNEAKFLWVAPDDEIEEAGAKNESQIGSLSADLARRLDEEKNEEANRLSMESDIAKKCEYDALLESFKGYSMTRKEG